MALTDEGNGGLVMPVAPMNGYGGNGGFGFGGDASWLIILFLFAMFGGWGNGFGGMGGGFGGGYGLYPWLNNSNQINDGFRDQMLNTTINGIQNAVTTGFGDVQTALCGGFAGVTAAVNGAQNAVAQQLYTNQIADLERSFAAQTAATAGMNALQAQLAQCCCDNRATASDIKYTIATENCADRAAISDGIRDVIASQNAGVQRILDQLCSDKIDAKNDEIAQLRQEVLFARGQASQIAQNQTIVDNIYNRLDTCPVGTTPVYGRTPIFTCPQNQTSCGCGGNAFYN